MLKFYVLPHDHPFYPTATHFSHLHPFHPTAIHSRPPPLIATHTTPPLPILPHFHPTTTLSTLSPPIPLHHHLFHFTTTHSTTPPSIPHTDVRNQTFDNYVLQKRLYKELDMCFSSLHSLVQICLQQSEGQDPNMSLLLGAHSKYPTGFVHGVIKSCFYFLNNETSLNSYCRNISVPEQHLLIILEKSENFAVKLTVYLKLVHTLDDLVRTLFNKFVH